MKKQKKKVTAITIGIIMGLLMFSLAGNIYLKQRKEENQKQKELLQEEKETLQACVEAQKAEQKTLEAELQEKVQSQGEVTEETEEETSEESSPKRMPDIQEFISEQILPRTDQNENWAVYVQKLTDGSEECAGQGKMQAASLIKLYIMGAVYENYDAVIAAAGKEKVDQLLHSMITVSDNEASNTLTKLLGGQDAKAGREAVNAYCSSQGYEDSHMGRMLLESKENGDNYTSVKDCGLFLERVYHKDIEHAEEMLSLLKQQERCEKIPAGVPAGIETANKTGELADVENDAAIVFAGDNPYILCIMSENLQNPSGARQTIVQLSSGIYEKLN